MLCLCWLHLSMLFSLPIASLAHLKLISDPLPTVCFLLNSAQFIHHYTCVWSSHSPRRVLLHHQGRKGEPAKLYWGAGSWTLTDCEIWLLCHLWLTQTTWVFLSKTVTAALPLSRSQVWIASWSQLCCSSMADTMGRGTPLSSSFTLEPQLPLRREARRLSCIS